MLFEFVLFAILGWAVFVEAPPRMVLMIVFIVLMVIWVALGIGPTVSSGGWGHLFSR
jgi:hypothetical protein